MGRVISDEDLTVLQPLRFVLKGQHKTSKQNIIGSFSFPALELPVT